MDVFSLLKFWRNAGVGDSADFNITDDDDDASFFDLVFTNPNDSPTDVNIISSGFHCSKLNGVDSKSNHTSYYSSSSPHSHTTLINFNNNTKILPLLDSSNTKTTPRSPFRVFMMLGFQNSTKLLKSDKLMKEMKCEIVEEEEVTIASLLKRDNSLRSSFQHHDDQIMTSSKRFSKDILHRYFNLIKPFYIKVISRSKSNRLHQQSSFYTSPVLSPRKEEKSPSGRKVFKNLGKSRSSSSSSVFKPPATKRDDSALQQQDGIQSAILHCKKSYNSPSQGCHVLSRSGSAPSQGPRISIEEEKRSSI